MEIIYKNNYAFVDGYKFRKDEQTGYYLSTRKINGYRPRLHVYIWNKYNGDIPNGYQIHHKDENKDNNEIDNLVCMTQKEHLKWHAENIHPDTLEKIKNNLDKARNKAKEWHSSPAGIEWHKKHAKKMNLAKTGEIELDCEYCGKHFISRKKHGRFCSPNCRTQSRRVNKKDHEQRVCIICGDTFSTNKYSKTRTCKKECSSKLSSITKKSAK